MNAKLRKRMEFPTAQLPEPEKEKHVQFNFEYLHDELDEMKEEQEQEPGLKRQKKVKKQVFATAQKRVRRRGSFTEGAIKYDDVKKLANPIDGVQGLSTKQVGAIKHMLRTKRCPMPDPILHMPGDFELFVDSLICRGYNSDEIAESSRYRQEIRAPNNSLESLEEVDFESSDEEEDFANMIPQPTNKREKQEAKKRTAKVKEQSLQFHGFDMN